MKIPKASRDVFCSQDKKESRVFGWRKVFSLRPARYWFWWSGTLLLESSNAKWRGTDMQCLQTSVLTKQGFSKSEPLLIATEEVGVGAFKKQ